jgi:hypothetical protein
MPRLKSISLSNNNLKELPEALGQLQYLEVLAIYIYIYIYVYSDIYSKIYMNICIHIALDFVAS